LSYIPGQKGQRKALITNAKRCPDAAGLSQWAH